MILDISGKLNLIKIDEENSIHLNIKTYEVPEPEKTVGIQVCNRSSDYYIILAQ